MADKLHQSDKHSHTGLTPTHPFPYALITWNYSLICFCRKIFQAWSTPLQW